MRIFDWFYKRYRHTREIYRIQRYRLAGQRPYGTGYVEFRNQKIAQWLSSADIMDAFLNQQPLPTGFGVKLDERAVEYPWVLSRLGPNSSFLLDAGSTLNQDFILSHPYLARAKCVIYNLQPEGVISSANVSYIYGDLRQTIFKDALFDTITCVSVLEHIGMDNAMIYSKDHSYREMAVRDYRQALKEFRRVLRPGGKLLLTIPYGRYENHGWLQQFDADGLHDIIETFAGKIHTLTFFKYTDSGWKLADAHMCAESRYNNFHDRTTYSYDGPVAAGAVACLELIK